MMVTDCCKLLYFDYHCCIVALQYGGYNALQGWIMSVCSSAIRGHTPLHVRGQIEWLLRQ